MAEEEIKDPGTVTFNDVAVYFSLHQWELLEDWQQLLYKNVMKEIHGALTALGYEIANPGILVKVQQSDEPCYSTRNEEQEEIKSKGPSQIRPDILLRVKMEEALSDQRFQRNLQKEEEELELREEEEEEEEEFSTDPSAAVFNPELSLWIKQEDEPGDQSSSMDDVIDVTPSRVIYMKSKERSLSDRHQVIKLAQKGKSQREISRLTLIPKSTVGYIIRRYKETGLIELQTGRGRKQKQCDAVGGDMNTKRFLFTPKMAAGKGENFGMQVTTQSMRNFLPP
ncbi:zinc finger protein 282 [Xenopus laevis]|uniref:Zinc finger protein 282 n=2 Tax=Xenopus laevis TaxID=8355 RepID=A0A310U4W2_XENLA|nr:zinc finger protein 282 [Xenopus laevis]OCT56660.1 hypothetical protein XELAEV_18004579mg [Xenopus laevis]